jgi:hypothetical protein
MMNELYSDFLNSIDAYLAGKIPAGSPVDLYQIGGSAVIMKYGMDRSTKDFDVISTGQSQVLDELARSFGNTSNFAKDRNFYLEVVPSGLPNVPGGFKNRCTQVEGTWKHLRLWQLEDHDLIITKLRRFSVQDRADIRVICDAAPITVQTLRDRLDSALAWYLKDDEYQEAPRKHLQRVIEYLDGKITTI